MNAFHIYYQKDEEISNNDLINLLVQFASIKFWKKNQGEIHLYCNENHLNTLEKWGVDKFYDSINLNCLEDLPYFNYQDKYWSFCKIHAIKKIAELYDQFVVLDTDLWIQESIKIDPSFQIIGYHEEDVIEDESNPYVNPSNFLNSFDINSIDWSMNPMNCAFLYLNSKELVDEWYKWVLKTIDLNKEKETLVLSADTIFIEQRLLTAIAYTLKMRVGKLLPNVYQPHIPCDEFGNEWVPKIGYNLENQYVAWNIKHVWGLKKSYDEAEIRNMVISTVVSSLDTFIEGWKNDIPNLNKEVSEILKEALEEMDQSLQLK
jgi:hypothetical protein